MKTKLFAVLTAGAALTLVLGSCNHPKTEDEAKVVVELAVTDITSTFAHVEATPSDVEATYYFDVVKKPGFDEIKSKGAQAFIDAEVERSLIRLAAPRFWKSSSRRAWILTILPLSKC